MSSQRGNIRWALGLGVAALWLVGCVVLLPTARPRAPGVTVTMAPPRAPAQVRAVVVGGPRLPHATHAGAGLECKDCHVIDAATGAPGYPDLAFCWECHQEMEEDEDVPPERQVAQVFFDAERAPRWIKAVQKYDAEIRFSHGAHATLECSACHGDMKETRRVAAELVSMTQCMDCHTQGGAPNACATCHAVMREGVAPPDHATSWETRHGPQVRNLEAMGQDSNCHYCHTQASFCDDCHQNQQPTSHRNRWESQHGQIVLRAGGGMEARCTFCHQDPSFCDDCHQEEAPASHERLWKERHGLMARAQGVSGQASCTFCHHDPAFCEDCHQDEEPRNHTTLFRTRTHGMVASIDRTSCRTCHRTDFCMRCHEDTAPRSHRGLWSRRRNTHCVQCHFPVSSEPSCSTCHRSPATHDTAPAQPASHLPGLNCRVCHSPPGAGGAPVVPHVDPGINCELCHPN